MRSANKRLRGAHRVTYIDAISARLRAIVVAPTDAISIPHAKAVGPPLSKPAPKDMPTASQEERSVSPKATAGNKVMNLYRAIRSCRRHEGSVLTYIQLLRPRTSARLILWGRTWAVAHRAPVNCQLNWRVLSHVENNSTCATKWETRKFWLSYKRWTEANKIYLCGGMQVVHRLVWLCMQGWPAIRLLWRSPSGASPVSTVIDEH